MAFSKGLPWAAQIGPCILMICLAFFAFTTILGWDYYSERSLEYLTGSMTAVKVYRWLYIFAVLIGPFFTVSAVWTIADIFNALMALPNLIALLALSGEVVKETKSYFERLENGLVIEQTKREKAERKARNLQQA
jgi:AGCS family alanine or glycine:cation symporter